jgi:prevent-host-death family protein
MKATAKDLRFHSKEIIEAVVRGEEVVITYRGEPRAKIVPIKNSKNEDKGKDKLFGIWRDNDLVKDVNQYVRAIRKGRFHAD